ncbi:exported hypothetical protein [Mesorhizobium metallidurans STM 2683]|uniref:Uncharacterized protein n=1 Tax=Mesorhizobium metallidurans STM 2683 TaxID=1297569 RepID=M5EPH3_9HYPH|nr:hypothetical protein [Mesorhizobium metallidurans]CCV06247.1 exported hypothetical protein [Mesorhizobium metallidurans STM 2683]
MNRKSAHDGKAVGATAAAVSTAAAASAVCFHSPSRPAGAYRLVSAIALLAVIAAWPWVAYRSCKSKARPAKTTLLVIGRRGVA